MTDIELIRTPSPGDNSYLVVSGDEAAVIDPQRDAWPSVRMSRGRGITVRRPGEDAPSWKSVLQRGQR
jgi:hypothetical protein